MEKNPYQKHKGFGLRVHRAESMLRRYGHDFDYDLHTRGFDNCFEMFDGDAVVFALMHKAYAEPDKHGQTLLTNGIQRMFGGRLNKNGFPQDWEDVAEGRAPNRQAMNLSFKYDAN